MINNHYYKIQLLFPKAYIKALPKYAGQIIETYYIYTVHVVHVNVCLWLSNRH